MNADLKREATAKVRLKSTAQHKIVGKAAPRIDIPAKMTGGSELPDPAKMYDQLICLRGQDCAVAELKDGKLTGRFDRNGILSQDWMSYPILTMPDVPKVETVLIDRPNERSLSAGEASQGPTVAAIANAFAAATGKRIRELPLTPERVKAALA